MENASKALIIAGAILISILLISLGIMVFNQSQDVTDNSGLSEAEITTFNSKFTKYEGNIKGSQVRSLIQEVNASNSTDKNKDANRLVTIKNFVTGDTNGYSAKDVLANTKTYKVTVTKYSKGTVSEITINDPSANT